MTRENIYYLIIGVLAIAFAAITYHVYQEHKLPGAVRFELGRRWVRDKLDFAHARPIPEDGRR